MYQNSVGTGDIVVNEIFLCSINISLAVCQRTHPLKYFLKCTECSERKVKVLMNLKRRKSKMAWEIHFYGYMVIQFGQNYNNLNIVLIG